MKTQALDTWDKSKSLKSTAVESNVRALSKFGRQTVTAYKDSALRLPCKCL